VYKLKLAGVEEAFRLELRNSFSALENIDDENNIETKWENIRDCITSAATETLGYRKNVKEEWLTSETWNLISERKKIKSKMLDCEDSPGLEALTDSYRDKDREIKRRARRYKRGRIEENASRAEEAARIGSTRSPE
jgi:hypothetical protein